MYKVLLIVVLTLVGKTTVGEENAERFEWSQTGIDLEEIGMGEQATIRVMCDAKTAGAFNKTEAVSS